MIYSDEEVYYSPRYLNNKKIDMIVKNPKIKKVILPKYYYDLMLRKNPNGLKRLLLAGIDVEFRTRKGRSRRIDEDVKKQILELYKQGYTILEISSIMNIPKSTIWDNVKNEIIALRESSKLEQLKELVCAYKEKLIEDGLYDNIVEMMFLELETYIKNIELKKANEILTKLISYINNMDED